MIINNKSYFALGGLAIIAQRDDPVSLHEIGRFFNISVSYLEQIFNKLKAAGVVHGVRGPRGGYILARSPDQITVPAVLTALSPNKSVDMESLDQSERMVMEMQNDIANTLAALTLQDLTHTVQQFKVA